MSDLFASGSAVLSPCGLYRYRLERRIGAGGTAAFIMVNPSTADAETDDATIRRLKGFAAVHGWGRIVVGNLFAFRSTDVRALGRAWDAVGPQNDHYLAGIAAEADRVIFAWGPMAKLPPRLRDRWREVVVMFWRRGHVPVSIGAPAGDGHPKHPLMLPYAADLLPWSIPA